MTEQEKTKAIGELYAKYGRKAQELGDVTYQKQNAEEEIENATKRRDSFTQKIAELILEIKQINQDAFEIKNQLSEPLENASVTSAVKNADAEGVSAESDKMSGTT